LLGRPWGDAFEYDEAMQTGDGFLGVPKALAIAAGTAAFAGLAAFSPTRSLLGRVLPESGEGPTPEAQIRGGFDVRFYGETAGGRTITTAVTGDRDPGYGSTARMLTESALAFSSVDPGVAGGGFWTPATLFGDALVERLVEHAGLTFEVTESG
jgi:short subunit dehydrogenase-like uncharacterized protein